MRLTRRTRRCQIEPDELWIGVQVEVRILGPLEVRVGGARLPLGGARQRAVLAMLILRANHVVPLDALMDGLWGERIPDTATNTVQAYVSRLRKLSAADRDGPGPLLLHRRSPGYVLEIEPAAVDLIRFEELAGRGARELDTSPARACATWREAEDLWRGVPLAEFVGLPFAVVESHRLIEAHLGVVCARIDADLTMGHHAALIPELEALIAAHPLHETLRRQLMLALYRTGRPADALAAFRRAKSHVAESLGLDPGRPLVDLEAAILRADPALDLPAADPDRDPGDATAGDPTGHPAEVPSGLPAAHPPGAAAPATGPTPPAARPPTRLPPRNPHFTGRADALDGLHRRLRAPGRTAPREALHGLGGVGKTQLAVEYAYRHRDEYRIVWWIDAQQPVLIPAQLAALAGRLGHPTTGTPADIVDGLLAHLATVDDWLLVFDNAERPDDIDGYLPGGAGAVIITSRFPGWGSLGARLHVDVFARDETVALLRSRIPDIPVAVAAELAAELGDLPLAAAQAAAYVEQSDLDAADYLRRFRTRRAGLLARGDVLGYQGRVDTAWDLAFERLALVSPPAVELIRIGSFLAPEPVPLELFAAHPELLTDTLRELVPADPDLLSDAVGAAVALSLAGRRPGAFQLHRLVQAVVRHRLTPAEQAVAGAAAAALLAAAHPGDPTDPAGWAAYARLAPHVLALGAAADADAPGRRLLLDTVGYLTVRGETRAGRALAEDLLERWRSSLGPDHPTTLALAAMLTSVLAWSGEGRPAVDLGEDTLRRCRDTLGPDDPVTLGTATYLTSALAWVGEADRAAVLGHETLQRCRDTLGPDHPTTLASAGQWAFTLLGLGRLAAAGDLTVHTVARSTAVLGPDHPVTLTAACALTFVRAWSGSADRARPWGEETLDRCRRAVGVDHWLSLTAAAGLTFALAGGGRWDAAGRCGSAALERSRRLLGADHWVTLLAAAAYTTALVGLGDVGEAEMLGRDSVERAAGSLGPDHPVTENLRQQLALITPAPDGLPPE